jgi:hypothetical protein
LTLVVVASVALGGCTGKPRPARVKDEGFEPDTSGNVVYMQHVPTSTRTVVNKNYSIGTRKVATVGEPMVGVRDYSAADLVTGAVPLRPFFQLCRAPGPGDDLEQLACHSGRLAMLRGQTHDRFDVAGVFTEAGKTYYLARIPGNGGSLYLAIDTSGRVKPGRYAAWAADDVAQTPAGVPLRWQDTPVYLQLEPEPLFRFETQESVAPSAAKFVHYELLYKGTTYDYRGMVYHLLYREYRREDPSLPLYEQDLEFSGSVTSVDVLGLRIRVEDVSDNQIVYTVLSD